MMTACEDGLETPDPQVNPQQPVLTDGDIVVEKVGVLASSDVINLNDYDDPDACTVEVLKLAKAEGLSDGTVVKLELQVSKTEDFASYKVLELTPSTVDGVDYYYADAYDWNDLQEAVFGKTLKPVTAYYRVPVYLNVNNTDYRYQSPTYYAVEGVYEGMKMQPGYVIEENYYVFGSFVGGNSPATGVVMYHDTQDVYDNPNFSYTFEVSDGQAEEGYTLLIAPEGQHNAQGTAANCYGLGDEEGVLVLGGSPIVVNEAGPYILEFNAYTLAYTLKVAPKSLYAQYAGANFATVGQLATEDYVTYEGMAGLLNVWGLTGQEAYRPTLYVNNPDVVTVTAENGTITGGIMFDPSGTPINASNGIPYRTAGLFYLTANLQSLEYSMYRCASLGLVGSMTNWGNETASGEVMKDVALTGSRTTLYMQWSGKLTVEAGDEWKIRANSDWVVNFGSATDGSYATDGSEVELTMGGANFIAPAAGTYNVTVYLRRYLDNGKMTSYYMTVTPAN